VELLWRWEVKKTACFGEHKRAVLELRAWLKKVLLCLNVADVQL
jgi:hypothetical protein